MKKPKISVIVPIYNEEVYLNQGIQSLIDQDYKNLEIILVNDGSTDNSKKIIDNFAKMDNRIKVIHKKNSGVSDSRNIAIDNSSGEYICFMDSDDYVSKDYISYLYKLLIENKADISLVPKPINFTSQTECDLIKKVNNKTNDKIEIWSGKKATAEMLYYHVKESSWCKLISKRIIDKYNIRYNTLLSCGEGFNFCTTCLQRADKVAVGSRNIYYYRVDNPHSAMTKFNINKLRNGITAIKLIDKNLIERTDELVDACHYAYWHTHCDFLNTIIGSNMEKKYKNDYKYMKKECRKYALCVLKAPISYKEKIKGIMYFISPCITARIINHFRLRKFVVENKSN